MKKLLTLALCLPLVAFARFGPQGFVLGSGEIVTDATLTGNTHVITTSTGSRTAGNCIEWDASGNAIDAGEPCGSAAVSASITVQDEGSSLTTALESLNFTGAGVSCTGTSSVTCDISGGGGGGGGDTSTNTSVSVDGELALFSSTSGKLLKRATGSGRPVLNSGVMSLSAIDLSTGDVTGDLPLANIVPASAASRFLCRGSAAGAGDYQECTFGSGLTLTGTELTASGGGGGFADGDYGDVTVSASSTAMTIDAGVVTLAKMADMATASLIGRNTASTGVPEVLSASTVRSLLSLVPGTNVQTQDVDLQSIVDATYANDDIIQRKAGALTNRTMAQLAADLLAVAPSVITETTTARTLAASDNEKTIRCTNVAGCTITVGTAFNTYRTSIIAGSVGAVTIVGSGTTLTCPASPCRINASGLAAVISPSGTNTFDVIGALGPVDAAEEAIASATTTSIFGTASKNVSVTGTTTIASLGTCVAGDTRKGRFTGILTFTNNAASLILPNAGSNITTAAGDRFEARCLGSDNVVIDRYVRADGTALVGLVSGGNIGAATATTPSADDNDTSVATTAYVQTELNAAGGRSVTCASGSCDADAELYTETYSIAWKAPAATDDVLIGKVGSTETPTSLDCVAQSGSGLTTIDVSIEECNTAGASCAGIGGTATMTAVDTNVADSSFTDTTLTAGNWLKAVIGTVTWTTPGFVTCTLKVTRND